MSGYVVQFGLESIIYLRILDWHQTQNLLISACKKAEMASVPQYSTHWFLISCFYDHFHPYLHDQLHDILNQ